MVYKPIYKYVCRIDMKLYLVGWVLSYIYYIHWLALFHAGIYHVSV